MDSLGCFFVVGCCFVLLFLQSFRGLLVRFFSNVFSLYLLLSLKKAAEDTATCACRHSFPAIILRTKAITHSACGRAGHLIKTTFKKKS